MAEPDQQAFVAMVKASLSRILGDSGATAMLFYLGEFDPSTFEAKLTSILGEGARIIMVDLNKSTGQASAAHKHHWLGGHPTSVLQFQLSAWSWARLPAIGLS